MTTDRDERLELMIGRVLKAGVFASGICLAVGLVLFYMPSMRGVASVAVNAGLIVLMITPVSRVVVSVYEYFRERDWTFVVLTVIVLVTLLGSLLVGLLT